MEIRRGKTYPHGSLYDGDDIVGAILVETSASLLIVEDDDCNVNGAKNAELISLFEEAVLSLEKDERDENTQ